VREGAARGPASYAACTMSRRRETASSLERSRRVRLGRDVEELELEELEDDDIAREIALGDRSGRLCNGVGLGAKNAAEDAAARATRRTES